jgi:hypothetical protein
MTDIPAEPDWSLLPRDPVRFFGLARDFDRRELKRRYNELIRRFKPERHPDEFQRIRSAYEQLDSGVRYGLQTTWSAPAEEYSWNRDTTSSRSTPGKPDSRTTPPAAPPFHERLQRENVNDVYRELEAKAKKTAFDYYALAVMSDVVAGDDGNQFARWLLQGLVDHQNDIGLLRLLNTYLRTSVESKNCSPLLLLCSQIVHENTFFPLTEPLWRLLVKSQDFSQFRDTLQQCESNLKGVSIDGRIAFYIQILKSAMWVADEAWIDQSVEFVEKNFERIPKFLDFDVEMVTRLRVYIKHRSTFAQGHPLFQRMDQALRDYFCEDQQVGDRGMLECQVQIVQNSDELADAFTNLVNPAYGPFYAVWGWVSHDVAERNIEKHPQPIDNNQAFTRTRALLAQIAQSTDNSRLGLSWMFSTLAYRIAQVLIYIGTAMLFVMLGTTLTPTHYTRNDNVVIGVILTAVVASGFLATWLKNQFRNRAWYPYCRWMAARCYRKLWRPEIFRFLNRSHLPYRALVAFVANAANSTLSRSDWVRLFVEQDFALPVYSMAQRFVV